MKAAALLALLLALPARAQVDPEARRLLQAGFSRTFDGRGPMAGYFYYYHSQPYMNGTRSLRFALAPVYLDTEFGVKQGFGPSTDLGVGVAGGGYADSYAEFRGGRYLSGESFTGDGMKGSLSAYHGFGKVGPAPLAGILRGELRYAEYRRSNDTSAAFMLPDAQTDFAVRSGLRWGGIEPLMLPKLAGEISVWYEGRARTAPGAYGYAGDRRIEPHSHMFWSRALIVYNPPNARRRYMAQVAGGTSRRADRFSAFRLGGVLPMAAEFPLSIPGYYYQEVSAESFGLAGGSYIIPLCRDRRTWLATLTAATAVVDYVPGTGTGNKWHSGLGAGISYAAEAWQALLEYGYGINAARGHGNGSHSLGLRLQFDFKKTRSPLLVPRDVDRGFDDVLDRLLNKFGG